MVLDQDTIVAIATPPGKGGVGIIRLSGSKSYLIASIITQISLTVRFAHYCSFYSNNNKNPSAIIDNGIAIFFQAPFSFTGEDIVELQAHGGPIVLDLLLNECIKNGARMARPGEFSERAFLNDKIDLIQAEAIADLIDSSSVEAAKNAVRSLQGNFSNLINILVEKIIHLRMFVESAIDFPEEEIDFLNDGHIKSKLLSIIAEIKHIINSANQGRIMRDGIRVVIVGKPNAGKSSLLNALAGHDAAIVTDIAGTTRDILKEQITIDGMPLHIIDTAGIHETTDIVEIEGIRRAWKAIEDADAILLVLDITKPVLKNINDINEDFYTRLKSHQNITIIKNKCDLMNIIPSLKNTVNGTVIHLSAKKALGIDLLKQHLKEIAGLENFQESGFTARRRHIDALQKTLFYLDAGMLQLNTHGAGELLAEDLRYCQKYLNEITGEYTNDDLLGNIFSSFCIGK